MGIERLSARLGWAWRILRERGARSVLHSLVERIRARLGFPSETQRGYDEAQRRGEKAFDDEIGVDTSAEQLARLTIPSRNRKLGTPHIGSNPDDFHGAMRALGADLADATFIDFGAGKGRALILATAYPFRAIIGIEFAKELCEAGQDNLARVAGKLPGTDRIELILADATDYELPEGPLILYFYNPFEAPIMDAVARRALNSWKTRPRPITVVYLNPVHLHVWLKVGWQTAEKTDRHAILTPAG